MALIDPLTGAPVPEARAHPPCRFCGDDIKPGPYPGQWFHVHRVTWEHYAAPTPRSRPDSQPHPPTVGGVRPEIRRPEIVPGSDRQLPLR
jgi:hypothetical protein